MTCGLRHAVCDPVLKTLQAVFEAVQAVFKTVQAVLKAVYVVFEAVHAVFKTVYAVFKTVHVVLKTLQAVPKRPYGFPKPVGSILLPCRLCNAVCKPVSNIFTSNHQSLRPCLRSWSQIRGM